MLRPVKIKMNLKKGEHNSSSSAVDSVLIGIFVKCQASAATDFTHSTDIFLFFASSEINVYLNFIYSHWIEINRTDVRNGASQFLHKTRAAKDSSDMRMFK